MEQKQIRAVLFDCDGVIINSAADIADAVNATLKAHGMRTVSYAKMRTFVGNGSVALVERAIKNSKRLDIESPLPIPQAQFKKIHAEYLQYYYS
ncbi:MAG: HAD hydrolase-like protein, partial [Treponemataceae bacterium]|nr:HAD hydrolase-like protein [Treponemataceae bacterium]